MVTRVVKEFIWFPTWLPIRKRDGSYKHVFHWFSMQNVVQELVYVRVNENFYEDYYDNHSNLLNLYPHWVSVEWAPEE